MSELQLQSGDLRVRCDASGGRLGFERVGKRLPWELDLAKTVQLVVRGKSSGASETTVPMRLGDLTLRRLSPTRLQWLGEVGGAGVALEIELSDGDLIFGVSPIGTGDAEIISANWPGELHASGDARELCWSNAQQGALFRADGAPWSATHDWTHAACRFFGLTVDEQTLAVIVDTPYDADAVFSDDGAGEMTCLLTFGPSLGTLGYARRVRLIPLAEHGYVAAANAYRKYAQQHGLWKSFAERVDENPEVEKLRGAFVACAGYFWDDGADQVAAMKTMRHMGFETGYLFSPKCITQGREWMTLDVEANRMSDEQIRAIQDLGYLCAPFLQVEEAAPSLGEEKFARDAEGNMIKRWQIDEDVFYEIAKWRVPAMLPTFDDRLQSCKAIHFDTVTAMRLVENHGEGPYSREDDTRLRMQVADYYRSRGKVICSESMREWGIAHVDLSTSKTFAPVSEVDPRVWTVPLTDLVYHDSTPRTHWEHHPYDDDRCVHNLTHKAYHPFGLELDDLLTCSPPVLFPEGMLYEFAHKKITRDDGTPDLEIVWSEAKPYSKRITDAETQAALPKALRVCRLNRHHGVSRMTSHRFVDPSRPFVQESEFATGAHVIVNFADAPFALADGRTLAGRSAIVDA